MSDIKSMTPEELLNGASYVVMCGDGNDRFIPGVFAEKSEADAHAGRMNSYGHSHYSVVEIDRTTDDGTAPATLEDARADAERLNHALWALDRYVERECEKLRNRHEHDSYYSMTSADRYRYECDREAYATMSTIYALISGATLGEYGGMMQSFPLPDYD